MFLEYFWNKSFPGAVRGQDRQDEDRLRAGSGGDGLAEPQGCLSKVWRAFAVPQRLSGSRRCFSPVNASFLINKI